MEHLELARARVSALGGAQPQVMKAFGQLHQAALADGALDAATKETIAVALAVALDCTGCVAWHVDAALKAGASADQLRDAVGVAVLFTGGPGAQRAGAAIEQIDAAVTTG